MKQRPRRNRRTQAIRDLCQESRISERGLIWPTFLLEAPNANESIASMPGQRRMGIDTLSGEIEKLLPLGLRGVCVFACVDDTKKDSRGSFALDDDHFYLSGLRKLKQRFGENLVVMTDLALDPYSSDGHDGLVQNGEVVNDETVNLLSQMAVLQADTGADWIGPSDMMDGRVGAVRGALDKAGYTNTAIISYSAKYASAFYGPFREALDSAPRSGDKKTYQMNPANRAEALREVLLDIDEGADIVMVKPALSYLDVIRDLSQATTVPLAAYNVSGEYSMIKAAAEKGWIDEGAAAKETVLSLFRAGAQIILSYWTPFLLKSTESLVLESGA
ncbi:MAG: porphobilinogen synthase [Bdellovibrionales bacterium CG10_big_fil_rev_8_21_14_0_10_45_34]|nr:MAG: porphobilinogen synthase [Bdellovibrionales bacterium CG10_big_fil_rev_8_21_14_0_10_45_34]